MILDQEKRDEDLETKEGRNMNLQLTDEQYDALLHYTFKAGLKHPEELLESFIADLSGWHRNGSDEEMHAQEWYDRAYRGLGGNSSFLFYLYSNRYDLQDLRNIAETFEHDPDEVYDEDPEEGYRELYGEIYPFDWYEEYLRDVRHEIDADSRQDCIKTVRYLLQHQKNGCIDWGHIDL